MQPIRVNFFSIFRQHSDGTLEPLRVVRIGGVQLSPGVRFGQGVNFGGINLFNFIGRDFQAEDYGAYIVLIGIF
jgi:hypothetical protein